MKETIKRKIFVYLASAAFMALFVSMSFVGGCKEKTKDNHKTTDSTTKFTLVAEETDIKTTENTSKEDTEKTKNTQKTETTDKKNEETSQPDTTVKQTETETETETEPPRPKDTTAPSITLTGEPAVTIQAGYAYNEPGYVATDNLEGDITSKVTIQTGLNIYIAGTYEIKYMVSDNDGNQAVASRIVNVTPVAQITTQPVDGKIIYLTFDDGPGVHTERLLDILDRFNVKATFFVCSKGRDDILKRMADSGHSIGLHSASHVYEKIYASEEAYFNDLNQIKNVVYNATGISSNIIRFPGGSSNCVSKFNPGIMTRLSKAVNDMGYQYFDWNVESRDAGSATTAEEVFKNVTGGIAGKQIAVVLQHDIKGFSVDAVEQIITWGLANGYTFLPLTQSSPVVHHSIAN